MPSTLRDRAEFLLCLMSPAIRIEPGFLRAVRTSLGPGFGNAGTEADVWQRLNPHHVAASFEPKQAKRYREEFSKLKIKRQKQVLSLLRIWHQHLPDEIWLEEVLNLSPDSKGALPEPQDLEDAKKFFTYVGQAFDPKNEAALASSRRHWFWRFDQRMTDQTGDDAVGRSLRGLAFELFKEDPGFQPSDSLDPAAIGSKDGKERPHSLGLEGGGLVVSVGGEAGSLLGHIRSANGLLRVAPVDQGEATDRNAFWASGRSPDWANNWGEDEAGFWVIIKVDGAAGDPIFQKLRWIPPGQFMMGSPSDEDGRYDDEDPRHEVIFDQGYWLFDTPCTQDLWEVVMGENPSNFKGGSRPVENVSWKDAKTFIERLNDRLDGLSLDLPSEAQWEYACRAGTMTAYSYGDRADAKQMNFDESGIKETTPVGRYPRNGWGLYDMHGNVLEWCADHWHGDYQGAPADGSAWLDDNTTGNRVLRGGSWAFAARYARAAYRYRHDPELRLVNFGFRCARVQASDGEAEPAGLASRRKAEPRRAQDPAGGAAAVIRLAEGEQRIFHPLPAAPEILIRSDREQLTLSRLTKPEWASGIGRDRFGLYATFSVEPETKRGGLLGWLKRMDFRESAALSPTGLVTQKMRWIPPGRFMMGSPEDEAGRWHAEGSQHEVTIGQGYWLFDTPCTQALWGAVMNKNPSGFKSPDRPVENVSWNEVQGFFEKVNERVEGLALALPSDAQWEYACRGGTTTSSYAGEVEFLGENNAPLLDDIAWYSGNSGVDFELENGHDSSDWKEKQYPHEKAGTRPVGQKRANPFGLYDMLGNVWEWCADSWHETYEGAPTDGSSWGDEGAAGNRVLRGGSWIYDAQFARAAFRYHYDPEDRLDFIGLRCARVQAE